MKWRSLSTTPKLLQKQTAAPKYDKPILRDRARPTNELYTMKSREGALPNCIVVIQDTMKSMYNVKQNNNIFDLYTVRGRKNWEKQAYLLYMG